MAEEDKTTQEEQAAQQEDSAQDDEATATAAPEEEEEANAETDAPPAEAEQQDTDETEAEAAEETDEEAGAGDAEQQAEAEQQADTPESEASTPENGEAQDAEEAVQQEAPAHRATVEDLLKAGSHYGHLTSRWHPRMKKYIFMERSNIHIIDLMQTQVLLDKAADAAHRFAERGKNILFVGTKKQAQEIVRENAVRVAQPHMVERWLGGTMTNFQTIRRSIRRMEEIEKMDADGTLDKLKKKEKLVRLREHDKLEMTLGGIRDLARLPGAVFVVDIRREKIAVREANKLGIPVIAMVDTNCDPGRVDYPIPANDDALSSIDLVTTAIADAIEQGSQERKAKKEADQQG